MVRVKPTRRGRGRSKPDLSLVCFLLVSLAGTLIILSIAWLVWEPHETRELDEKLYASSTPAKNDSRLVAPMGDPTEQAGMSKTIGYAITLTGCGAEPITDGAAILKHSIHLVSSRSPDGGKYDYKMYAIVHPAAIKCASVLKDIGYTLLERDTPVQVKDIKGDFLRERIERNGCCGEKELVKLEAYTLI